MMKSKDAALATALIIHGYLRANEEKPPALLECLAAIRGECNDWSENLEDALPDDGGVALEPDHIVADCFVLLPMSSVAGPVMKRTPYNLVSAALAMLDEAICLSGPDTIARDFVARAGSAFRPMIGAALLQPPRPLGEVLGATENVGSTSP